MSSSAWSGGRPWTNDGDVHVESGSLIEPRHHMLKVELASMLALPTFHTLLVLQTTGALEPLS